MVGFGTERYADPKRGAWIRKRKGQASGSDAPRSPPPSQGFRNHAPQARDYDDPQYDQPQYDSPMGGRSRMGNPHQTHGFPSRRESVREPSFAGHAPSRRESVREPTFASHAPSRRGSVREPPNPTAGHRSRHASRHPSLHGNSDSDSDAPQSRHGSRAPTIIDVEPPHRPTGRRDSRPPPSMHNTQGGRRASMAAIEVPARPSGSRRDSRPPPSMHNFNLPGPCFGPVPPRHPVDSEHDHWRAVASRVLAPSPPPSPHGPSRRQGTRGLRDRFEREDEPPHRSSRRPDESFAESVRRSMAGMHVGGGSRREMEGSRANAERRGRRGSRYE